MTKRKYSEEETYFESPWRKLIKRNAGELCAELERTAFLFVGEIPKQSPNEPPQKTAIRKGIDDK